MNVNFYEKEPVSLYLDNLDIVEDIYSAKQHIQLLQHPWLGKILVINDEIQHVEKYQSLYHEMLVHLPISFIPHVENVLILGGGSLFAAFEVLKYPTVKRLVLCDYDGAVLSLMKKYYVHANLVMQDQRFEHLEQDAHEFVQKCTNSFDLVINDCFNLAKESDANNYSLYKTLSKLCSSEGVCVDIIYRHIFDKSTTINTLNYLYSEANLTLSLVFVPEYPGILHLETIWGKSSYISQSSTRSVNDIHLSLSDKDSRMFDFFSPKYLPAYLYLPPYIKSMFNL